ncbi:hypothetical protein DXG01_002987 [Tephrocybe rancida]|nr:hypothetical protein DXG01_002987 [Tephrocybe rancida]
MNQPEDHEDTQDLSDPPPPGEWLPAPAAFVTDLINTYRLNPNLTRDLHAFLLLGPSLSDDDKRSRLFTAALMFQVLEQVRACQTTCDENKEALDLMKQNMQEGTAFTKAHEAEMKAACRFVLFQANRTDFSNPGIIDAARTRLKSNKKNNGFAIYFDSPTQAQIGSLRKLASSTASSVKSQFRTLIKDGILGTPRVGPISLTTMLRRGMTQLLCVSDSDKVVEVELAFHLLIVRAFARKHPDLLREASKRKAINLMDNNSNSDDNDDTFEADSNGPRATGAAAGGNDFFTQLSNFYLRKGKRWGSDLKGDGWAGYIKEALEDEMAAHPDDTIPLIPRVSQSSTSVVLTSLTNNQRASPAVHSSTPQASFNTLFCAAAPSTSPSLFTPSGPPTQGSSSSVFHGSPSPAGTNQNQCQS